MNIYIANLSFSILDEELRRLFATYGEVTSAKVVMDKFSNRSKGFGFVEMSDEKAGQKAVSELNGSMLDGRPLTVNLARPKKDSW
ncbi:MAG: RNA-binding protein [Terrimonas sp.]|nr:RNA-binding protein [Terrimonas sp.]